MLADALKYLVNFTKKKNYISSEINMLIAADIGCVIIYNVIFYVHMWAVGEKLNRVNNVESYCDIRVWSMMHKLEW